MAIVGTESYLKHSPQARVLCRVTKWAPDKPWMKHGTWNAERSVMPFSRGPKVKPMGTNGLIIWRKTP